MRYGFFISEVICIAFHRYTKSFSKNIISCRRSFLGSFYVQLIFLILVQRFYIGVSLYPHIRIGYFINGIEFVPPDRNMWIDIITFEYIH